MGADVVGTYGVVIGPRLWQRRTTTTSRSKRKIELNLVLQAYCFLVETFAYAKHLYKVNASCDICYAR